MRIKGIRQVDGQYTARPVSTEINHMKLMRLQTELLPRLGSNWHRHSLVTQTVGALARTIYYDNLYKKIVDVPGVICEFGVQYGATMTNLVNLRSIYEPFNQSRLIIGFDTFKGFPKVDVEDGGFSQPGDYATEENYEEILDSILEMHESFSPNSHLKKFELVKGDASITIDSWLEKNSGAVIAMAIFDMDLYAPTKAVLEKILPRLTKGSILAFDELSCGLFPGETVALSQVLGLSRLALRRSPLQPYCAWGVYEG